MNTSPRFPANFPSMNSSVDASCRFMYASVDTRNPLYSIPHFSFTSTCFPVSWFRKGFGFTGTVALIARRSTARRRVGTRALRNARRGVRRARSVCRPTRRFFARPQRAVGPIFLETRAQTEHTPSRERCPVIASRVAATGFRGSLARAFVETGPRLARSVDRHALTAFTASKQVVSSVARLDQTSFRAASVADCAPGSFSRESLRRSAQSATRNVGSRRSGRYATDPERVRMSRASPRDA